MKYEMNSAIGQLVKYIGFPRILSMYILMILVEHGYTETANIWPGNHTDLNSI